MFRINCSNVSSRYRNTLKKVLGSGNKTLIISNDEIEDIIKIGKSLEDFGLLLKGVTEPVQNEVKEQKTGSLIMSLGTLAAISLGKFFNRKRNM